MMLMLFSLGKIMSFPSVFFWASLSKRAKRKNPIIIQYGSWNFDDMAWNEFDWMNQWLLNIANFSHIEQAMNI